MGELQVNSLFHMSVRGTVFAGTVIAGEINLGDRMQVKSPLATVDFTVAGVEKDREFISTAIPGESVGVLALSLDLDAVSDGLKRTDDGAYEVFSLVLVEQPRKWWEFWR